MITTSSVLAPPEGPVLGDWGGNWDEDAIHRRTAWLAGLAMETWPRLDFDPEDEGVEEDFLADEQEEGEEFLPDNDALD